MKPFFMHIKLLEPKELSGALDVEPDEGESSSEASGSLSKKKSPPRKKPGRKKKAEIEQDSTAVVGQMVDVSGELMEDCIASEDKELTSLPICKRSPDQARAVHESYADEDGSWDESEGCEGCGAALDGTYGIEGVAPLTDEYDRNDYSQNENESDGPNAGEFMELSPNQLILTMSYSLLNQVRQVARAEGVTPEDIVLELIAEGVTRRAFEDASRPAPSHLMTRTGYVPPDADGYQAPRLSHHNSQQQSSGFSRPNGPNGPNGQQPQRRFNNGGGYNQGRGSNNNRFNRQQNGGSQGNRNNGQRYVDPRTKRDQKH